MLAWVASFLGAEAVDALAKFALGLVREWLARDDLQRAERQALVIERLELQAAALEWAARAAARPDGGAGLRVEPDAPTITGVALDADPPGARPDGDVRAQ